LAAYWAFELSESGTLFTLDLPHDGAEGICVNRYRSDGRLVWSRLCDENLIGEMDLAPANGEGVYVAAEGARSTGNLMVYKLNARGRVLWHKTVSYGKADLTLRAVSTDPEGNVYLAGDFDRIGDNEGAMDRNVFIRKYAPDGTFAWNRHLGVPEMDEQVTDMDVAQEDVVFLGGYATPSRSRTMEEAAPRGFLFKLTGHGKPSWAL